MKSRFQFRLRTLLIVVAIQCCVMAVVSSQANR